MVNNFIFEKDKWLSFTSFLQTTWLYPCFRAREGKRLEIQLLNNTYIALKNIK